MNRCTLSARLRHEPFGSASAELRGPITIEAASGYHYVPRGYVVRYRAEDARGGSLLTWAAYSADEGGIAAYEAECGEADAIADAIGIRVMSPLACRRAVFGGTAAYCHAESSRATLAHCPAEPPRAAREAA